MVLRTQSVLRFGAVCLADEVVARVGVVLLFRSSAGGVSCVLIVVFVLLVVLLGLQ